MVSLAGLHHSITIVSAKTRSAFYFSATYQEGQSTEGWNRSGHIGWGHLWKDLLLFSLENGYLQVYSSHWAGGCLGVRLPSIVTVSTNFTALYLAHREKSSRFITEEITTRTNSSSSRILKLALNPNAESRQPFDRDSPQHNDPWRVGKVEKKRTGEQSKRVQKFCLNPPTETVRHGQVLSCLELSSPSLKSLSLKNFEFSRYLSVQWRSRKAKVAPRPVENPRAQILKRRSLPPIHND